jgi:hypothetical protein
MNFTPNRRCDTCAAYFTSPEGQTFCRKNPPDASVIVVPSRDALGQVVPAMQTVATWPPVQKDQWCMAWAPKLMMQ